MVRNRVANDKTYSDNPHCIALAVYLQTTVYVLT